MDVGNLKVAGNLVVGDVPTYNEKEHAEGYTEYVTNQTIMRYPADVLTSVRRLSFFLSTYTKVSEGINPRPLVLGRTKPTPAGNLYSYWYPTLLYSAALQAEYIETWWCSAHVMGVERGTGLICAQLLQFCVQCIGSSNMSIPHYIQTREAAYAEGAEIPGDGNLGNEFPGKIIVDPSFNTNDGFGNVVILVKNSETPLTIWTCRLDVSAIICKKPDASSGS